MTRIQDTRRATPSKLPVGDAFLREHASTIEGFKRHRKDGEAFSRYATSSRYGDMMAAVRRAAVTLRVNPKHEASRVLLEDVARAIDVPLPDLVSLDSVPAHLVASGRWRPRSVNVDLIDPDESSRLAPESKFQAQLNHFSEKVLPKTRAVKVSALYPAYAVAGAVTPVVGAVGRTVATPMNAVAEEVRGWSDGLADEVQLALRRIRDATSASGLRMGDMKKLHPIEQRMMVMTGQALHGMALDAELFIQWARDPKSVQLPKGFAARVKKWASSSLDGLARFLKATASGVKTLTDEESWRTFSVHAQFGGGLEKFWVSARGGVSLMFPTLEQVQRDGEVVMQVVPRLNPVDTLLGGVSLTSRGGGVNFRAGPVGAKVSDFEHEVKAGIPGIIGIAVGEDYAYGPVVAFGYSPPVGLLNVLPLPVNVRVGGEVKLFHPAFAGISRPTRRMAERISIGCDVAHRALKRAIARLRGKELEGQVDGGWPVTQRWNLARALVDRSGAAEMVAHARLERLASIAPDRLDRALSKEALEMLGQDATTPAKTHATIREYLEHVTKRIDAIRENITELAELQASGVHITKKALSAKTEELRRTTAAFEFVDVLLEKMFPAEAAAPATFKVGHQRPPRPMRRDEVRREKAS